MPKIYVRATKKGYYEDLREEGATFYIKDKDAFSENWMEAYEPGAQSEGVADEDTQPSAPVPYEDRAPAEAASEPTTEGPGAAEEGDGKVKLYRGVPQTFKSADESMVVTIETAVANALSSSKLTVQAFNDLPETDRKAYIVGAAQDFFNHPAG